MHLHAPHRDYEFILSQQENPLNGLLDQYDKNHGQHKDLLNPQQHSLVEIVLLSSWKNYSQSLSRMTFTS